MPKRGKFFYGDDGNDVGVAPRRRGNFYGDDGNGNNVDIAQRHAPATLSNPGDGDTENVVKAAMRARPKATNNDDVKGKRLEDEIRGSMAGYDTTPDDEALLRQENIPGNRTNAPIPDEYTEQAERMVGKNNWGGNTPMRAKFVEYFANQLRGAAPAPETQPEEQEKPFNNNDVFENPEELRKVGRLVRPPRL